MHVAVFEWRESLTAVSTALSLGREGIDGHLPRRSLQPGAVHELRPTGPGIEVGPPWFIGGECLEAATQDIGLAEALR